MYQIAKRFEFSAAHRILGLPTGHKCSRLHGHNFLVEVVVEATELDARGFAGVDYGEFGDFKRVVESWDHRTILRAHDPIADYLVQHEKESLILVDWQPTSENIARHLYRVAIECVSPNVVAVRVSETSNTWADFYKP